EEFARDPEAKDENGQTPLMKAVDKADHKAVQSLLQRGVNVAAQDNEGRTATMRAASRGDAALLGKIYSHAGGNYEARLGLYSLRDKQGRTALMQAAEGGHADGVVQLIENGREIYGRTGFADYVVTLVITPDKEGKNSLMLAAAKGQDAAVAAILQAFGDS